MAIKVDLQNDDALDPVPSSQRFQEWIGAALLQPYAQLEQTIRVVTESESRDLNNQYRAVDSPTNVLAFPSDSNRLGYDCLGDLVICAPVVISEALQQNKPVESHWAHMVVHGMLHLQGFDHQNESQAEEMEALETRILVTLGYTNPYND